MKTFMYLTTASIICILSAVYLAVSDVEGWGWFLFVAFFIFPSYSSTEEKKE